MWTQWYYVCARIVWIVRIWYGLSYSLAFNHCHPNHNWHHHKVAPTTICSSSIKSKMIKSINRRLAKYQWPNITSTSVGGIKWHSIQFNDQMHNGIIVHRFEYKNKKKHLANQCKTESQHKYYIKENSLVSPSPHTIHTNY